MQNKLYRSSFVSIMLIIVIMLTSCKIKDLSHADSSESGDKSTVQNEYIKYQATFMDVFDTYSIILGYSKTKQEFDEYANIMYQRLTELDHQYDIYNDYEGINNLKTVNDYAGIEAVKVSDDIIKLLKFGKQAYEDTDGIINITMGSVLRIWHDYRTEGKADPDNAKLPPMEDLKEAVILTDINDLIINETEGTVYLAKKGMSLDVGAIAKGFATQLAVDDAVKAGMVSALADIGGNVCSVGKPLDGIRDRWGVGIQDPELSIGDTSNIVDTIYVNNISVVTSGNYQRYYVVDGEVYNHIIDPDTLMPAVNYASVSVVCSDSGIADMLSTYLYITSVEDGREMLKKLGAEAIWIHLDGSIETTEGYDRISKKYGNYGAVDDNLK